MWNWFRNFQMATGNRGWLYAGPVKFGHLQEAVKA